MDTKGETYKEGNFARPDKEEEYRRRSDAAEQRPLERDTECEEGHVSSFGRKINKPKTPDLQGVIRFRVFTCIVCVSVVISLFVQTRKDVFYSGNNIAI